MSNSFCSESRLINIIAEKIDPLPCSEIKDTLMEDLRCWKTNCRRYHPVIFKKLKQWDQVTNSKSKLLELLIYLKSIGIYEAGLISKLLIIDYNNKFMIYLNKSDENIIIDSMASNSVSVRVLFKHVCTNILSLLLNKDLSRLIGDYG